MPVGEGVAEAAAEEAEVDAPELAEIESDLDVEAAAALVAVEAGEADDEVRLVVSVVSESHCQ